MAVVRRYRMINGTFDTRSHLVTDEVSPDWRRIRKQLPEMVDPLGELGIAQPRIMPNLVKRPAHERAHLVTGAAVPDHLLDRATDIDEGVDVANPERDFDLAARDAMDELPSPPSVPARGAGEHGPNDVRDLLVVVLHDTLR